MKFCEVPDSGDDDYKSAVSWDVTPCSLVDNYSLYMGTVYLHLYSRGPGITGAAAFSETSVLIYQTRLHIPENTGKYCDCMYAFPF